MFRKFSLSTGLVALEKAIFFRRSSRTVVIISSAVSSRAVRRSSRWFLPASDAASRGIGSPPRANPLARLPMPRALSRIRLGRRAPRWSRRWSAAKVAQSRAGLRTANASARAVARCCDGPGIVAAAAGASAVRRAIAASR